MPYSNCLIHAVTRWILHGGYVLIRKSKYGWWPHFLWSLDLSRFEHYIPVIPAHTRRFPPVLFRGRVVDVTRETEQGV